MEVKSTGAAVASPVREGGIGLQLVLAVADTLINTCTHVVCG